MASARVKLLTQSYLTQNIRLLNEIVNSSVKIESFIAKQLHAALEIYEERLKSNKKLHDRDVVETIGNLKKKLVVFVLSTPPEKRRSEIFESDAKKLIDFAKTSLDEIYSKVRSKSPNPISFDDLSRYLTTLRKYWFNLEEQLGRSNISSSTKKELTRILEGISLATTDLYIKSVVLERAQQSSECSVVEKQLVQLEIKTLQQFHKDINVLKNQAEIMEDKDKRDVLLKSLYALEVDVKLHKAEEVFRYTNEQVENYVQLSESEFCRYVDMKLRDLHKATIDIATLSDAQQSRKRNILVGLNALKSQLGARIQEQLSSRATTESVRQLCEAVGETYISHGELQNMLVIANNLTTIIRIKIDENSRKYNRYETSFSRQMLPIAENGVELRNNDGRSASLSKAQARDPRANSYHTMMRSEAYDTDNAIL